MTTDRPPNPKNHLPKNFYTMPAYANTTLTRTELRETLLATDGWIMACGRNWNIKSQSLGAGVYGIKLESRNG